MTAAFCQQLRSGKLPVLLQYQHYLWYDCRTGVQYSTRYTDTVESYRVINRYKQIAVTVLSLYQQGLDGGNDRETHTHGEAYKL